MIMNIEYYFIIVLLLLQW